LIACLANQASELFALKLIELNDKKVLQESDCEVIKRENTTILLKDVCAGNMRLVRIAEFQTTLNNIAPNLVTEGNIELEFSVGIKGIISIELFNIHGVLMQIIFSGHCDAGGCKKQVKLENCPQGAYYICL